MLLSEAVQGRRERVQIFATDISNNALKVARAGLYSPVISADVSPERLRRFFVREGDGYRVVKSLREMVVFASQDIKGDPPFSRVDLVSCRNLLIYLTPTAQKNILAKIHFALRPGGFLFLGNSETPSRGTAPFEPISTKWRIYRRRRRRFAPRWPTLGGPAALRFTRPKPARANASRPVIASCWPR